MTRRLDEPTKESVLISPNGLNVTDHLSYTRFIFLLHRRFIIAYLNPLYFTQSETEEISRQ